MEKVEVRASGRRLVVEHVGQAAICAGLLTGLCAVAAVVTIGTLGLRTGLPSQPQGLASLFGPSEVSRFRMGLGVATSFLR